MFTRRSIGSLFVILVSFIVPVAALGADVHPGYNLFRTIVPTYHNFSGPFSIPATFFDPGSDPFEGTVAFVGVPLGAFTPCPGDIGPTDTIVRRKSTAFLPGPGSSDVIPIEIVQLSLVSAAPIIVTYSGGMNPEPWDVRWSLSSSASSTGSMTVRQLNNDGGTFDATLPVHAVFTFTRQSDFATRILDLGGMPDVFVTPETPWSYSDPWLQCPGCTANFVPGVITAQAQFAVYSAGPGCLSATPVTTTTWGNIKVLYR